MPKTYIEVRLSEILQDLGLRHYCNARLYGYEVDAQLIDYPAVIIEADGTLWHGGDRLRYDNMRDSWLHSKGYKIIRVWGTDLVHNPKKVREKLIIKLSRIVKGFGNLSSREIRILTDIQMKIGARNA